MSKPRFGGAFFSGVLGEFIILFILLYSRKIAASANASSQ